MGQTRARRIPVHQAAFTDTFGQRCVTLADFFGKFVTRLRGVWALIPGFTEAKSGRCPLCYRPHISHYRLLAAQPTER
jgi:hypothetical protein